MTPTPESLRKLAELKPCPFCGVERFRLGLGTQADVCCMDTITEVKRITKTRDLSTYAGLLALSKALDRLPTPPSDGGE